MLRCESIWIATPRAIGWGRTDSKCRLMEKPDYSCQSVDNNASRCFVYPAFQRRLFFDKAPETGSLVGTHGKEYTFYQLCRSYPPERCVWVWEWCAVRMLQRGDSIHSPGPENRLHSVQRTTGSTLAHCTQMDNILYIWFSTKKQGSMERALGGRVC